MMEQPKPIDIQIPVKGGAVMYSMMDEFSLRRLHKFIGNLIDWKAAGNHTVIETQLYAVITKDET